MRRPGKTRVSQQDIARDLGVSQGLVSMALSGRTDVVHAETCRRILEHADRLGYRRKSRRFHSNGSEAAQVGFILRPGHTLYNQSSFYSQVQHCLHVRLELEGISTHFVGTEETLRKDRFRALSRLGRNLFGLVVMGEVDPEFLFELKRRYPRLVAVAASYPGRCHSVLNNEAQTFELLVEHLWKLCHRSFAWIGGNSGSRLLDRRTAELQQALRRRGLGCPPRQTEAFPTSTKLDGQEAARRLISRFGTKRLPTAWIGYNGRMARGALNHLLACGVSVPGEVSVTACDGTYICEDEKPAITGAYADPAKIAEAAGSLLLESTGEPDETFQEITPPAILKVRDSSGRAAAGV